MKVYSPLRSKGDYDDFVKLTKCPIIGCENKFCCCKSEELPNSFLTFCLYF